MGGECTGLIGSSSFHDDKSDVCDWKCFCRRYRIVVGKEEEEERSIFLE
jgi:hypothetical protein